MPIARLAALSLGAALLLASPASAQLVVFDWTDETSGSAGGINASVTATVNSGVFAVGDRNATAPGYTSLFPSPHSVLNYNALASGVPANIESTIAFSQPLPEGARLVVLDVDFFDETAVISADGSPPALIAQIESALGASSIFPIWNPVAGTLVENAPNNLPNDGEASIFDLSGVSTLQLDFLNGATSSGISVAIAIPPPAVPILPLPALLPLTLLLASAALLAHRNHPRERPGPQS